MESGSVKKKQWSGQAWEGEMKVLYERLGGIHGGNPKMNKQYIYAAVNNNKKLFRAVPTAHPDEKTSGSSPFPKTNTNSTTNSCCAYSTLDVSAIVVVVNPLAFPTTYY